MSSQAVSKSAELKLACGCAHFIEQTGLIEQDHCSRAVDHGHVRSCAGQATKGVRHGASQTLQSVRWPLPEPEDAVSDQAPLPSACGQGRESSSQAPGLGTSGCGGAGQHHLDTSRGRTPTANKSLFDGWADWGMVEGKLSLYTQNKKYQAPERSACIHTPSLAIKN